MSNKPVSRHKHQLVAADILYRIQHGEWRKGTKIPSIDQLAEAYPYARMTVFKAVEYLVDEGYLEVRRGVGTFVARDRLLGTVGLVIGEEVLHPQQTPLAFMLSQHLRRQFERLGYHFKLYIDTSPGHPAIPLDLREDITARRLVALITASCDTTLALPEWPTWVEARLPYVDITGHPIKQSQILMDRHGLIKLFFQFCLEHDYRSAGAIVTDEENRPVLMEEAAAHGITVRDEWLASEENYTDYERTGFTLLQKLWRLPERPRAIMVLDDIACKGVVQAVLQLGIRVPDELAIVTQANKESGVFYPLPIPRIEFDVDECARLAVNSILDQINDPELPPRADYLRPSFTADESPHAAVNV